MEIGSLEDIAKAWDGIDVDHTDNGKCTGCGVEEMAVIAKLAVDRIAEKFTKD